MWGVCGLCVGVGCGLWWKHVGFLGPKRGAPPGLHNDLTQIKGVSGVLV